MSQLISVIIPVHNEEKRLVACLDSILRQTYKNIEIIMVDDASDDRTAEVCETYKTRDSRIQIIKPEHDGDGLKGPGISRKRGCACAAGSFVCFVDADDYIESDMIEKMSERQMQTDADIVCCGLWEDFSNGKSIKRETEEQIYSNQDGEEPIKLFIKKLFYDKAVSSYFWNKMFRMELLHKNISLFSEKSCFEDLDTVYKLTLRCDRIACIKGAYYHYIRRPSYGIMSGWNAEKARLFMDVHEEARKEFALQMPDLEEMMWGKCMSAAAGNYKALLKAPLTRDNTEALEDAKQYLQKHRKWMKYIADSREKLHVMLIIYFPWLMKCAIKLKAKIYY